MRTCVEVFLESSKSPTSNLAVVGEVLFVFSWHAGVVGFYTPEVQTVALRYTHSRVGVAMLAYHGEIKTRGSENVDCQVRPQH